MEHIDGPWGSWPFGSVYQGILAVTDNFEVETTLTHAGHSRVLRRGEFMMFDFNTELHKIRNLNEQEMIERFGDEVLFEFENL